MKNLGFKTAAQALLTLGGLALVACNAPASSQTPQANAPATGPVIGAPTTNLMVPARPDLPDGTTLNPLPDLNGPHTLQSIQQLAVNANPNVVGLKVLILSAGSSDFGVAAARAMLDQAGVPYDSLDASLAPLTADALVAADGSGKYQGVILTSGSLSYQSSPGVYQSALDWTGWNVLWNYEATYKARQLSLYTYPSTWPEDYGLRDAGAASGSSDVQLTAGASSVFTDLRAGSTVPIRNAYNYPATVTPVAGVTTTPLLTDASGRVLAATSTTAGRERLALTFAQNQYLLPTQLLSYSLVNWLTRGVYLGDYRRFNQLDIDDWFLADDVFDDVTKTLLYGAFRISASDAMALPAQMNALRSTYPAASAFKFAVMFNGSGANLSAPASCDPNAGGVEPLTSVSRCLKDTFDWVNHTFDHENLDTTDYAFAVGQIKPNYDVAASLGLNLSPHTLLTGEMSGLGYFNTSGTGIKTDYGLTASNRPFLQAAQDNNVWYVPSNHSVASQVDAACPNCGIIHPLNNSIFLVPRWPTNIFYDVTNPAQAAAAYNSVYGPGGTAAYWPTPLSYDQILDKESAIALNHWLSGSAFPHYMHQGNLRQYAPGHSLAYDWEAATLKKYSAYSTLPLNTLRWDDLGAYVKDHTSYLKSGTSGTWNRLTHVATLKSGIGGAVYLTGGIGGTLSSYAGRNISRMQLAAGQSTSIYVP